MVSDPLLLLGALLLVVLLSILARRLSRNRTPEIAPESRTAAADAADTAAVDADIETPFLPAPDGPADDLARIKGIGPKLSARLEALGVFHYRQIAGWTPAQLALVDRELGQFEGRPARDRWQEQARLLAEGDTRAFERAHGKLGPAPGDGGNV